MPVLKNKLQSFYRILRQPPYILQLLRNTVNQRLRLFPAKARVSNGFAEYAFTDLLASVFQIALNHEALDKLFDVIGVTAAVHDFVGDTNLCHVLLAGVGVVSVNDAGHILKAFFGIAVVETAEILKMVVRDIVAMFIDSTAENSMSQRIAGGFDFPASVGR